MRDFSDYFKIIIEHEGGLGEHPNDPGGITKYGISLVFLKTLSLQDADIDNDGDIDRDDIKALTVEDSKELYKKFFWDPLHLEGVLSEELKLHLFDHGVNAGTRTAAKLLQRILNVDVDGSIGPDTIKKTNAFAGDLVKEYKKAREAYYLAIIEKNSKLSVFKKGWLHRIETTKF